MSKNVEWEKYARCVVVPMCSGKGKYCLELCLLYSEKTARSIPTERWKAAPVLCGSGEGFNRVSRWWSGHSE